MHQTTASLGESKWVESLILENSHENWKGLTKKTLDRTTYSGSAAKKKRRKNGHERLCTTLEHARTDFLD